jgi:hypothetical protein
MRFAEQFPRDVIPWRTSGRERELLTTIFEEMAPRGAPRRRSPSVDEQMGVEEPELSNPQKTLQHLFLQALISRRSITQVLARSIYKACTELCSGELAFFEWCMRKGEGSRETRRDYRGRVEASWSALAGALITLLIAVKNPEAFETFIAELEPGLSLLGLDIKTTRDQETGTPCIVLVRRLSRAGIARG